MEASAEIPNTAIQPMLPVRAGKRYLPEIPVMPYLPSGAGPLRGDPRHGQGELVKR